jgi:hypothetical protein
MPACERQFESYTHDGSPRLDGKEKFGKQIAMEGRRTVQSGASM